MSCQHVTPEGQPCLLQDHLSDFYTTNGRNSFCIYHLPNNKGGNIDGDRSAWLDDRVNEFNEGLCELIGVVKRANEVLDMQGCIFPAGLEVTEEVLPECNFSRSIFLGDISFNGSVFTSKATFDVVKIAGDCDFSSVGFKGDFLLTGSTIGGELLLLSTKCKSMATFSGLEINNSMHATEAVFESAFVCVGSTIGGYSNFNDVKFNGTTTFLNTRFSFVTFNDVVAVDSFWLNGVEVADYFSSLRSVFNSGFNMDGSKNRRELSSVDFSDARFEDGASFMNRDFLGSTTFDRCMFRKAPKFHNTTLHQDTGFEDIAFKDTSKEAARSYRTLKQAMESVRSRREEGMFFALEQRCLRNNKSISASVRFLSWLYDATSSYGQSTMKPVYWMIGILTIFACVYAYLLSPVISMGASFDFGILKDAFAMSIKQAVTPFYIWKENSELTISLFGTLQSILFLGMFALFLLAIRWRFKRG